MGGVHLSGYQFFAYQYSGTRLDSKLLVFFGFSVCSHVYLLNYRSELAQIWRQDTDTIHDHNHTKKIISMQVRSVIMGRNGRGQKSKLCLEQIWHIFFTHGLQFITHLRFGPDFTVQPSPVLRYKVSPHKCQLKVGFSLFSDVQKCLEHSYPIILESWSKIWICHAVMIQLTWS